MQRFDLSAQFRSDTGKGVARKLRAQGKIPAVLYGAGTEPKAISLDRREISMLMRKHEGHHLLVNLNVEGPTAETALTIVQEITVDPVSRIMMHADFWRVDAKKPMHTTVPLHPVGAPIGVKEGGVLQHLLREVEVEALPADLPERIEVDISGLHIGESIHVSDLTEEGSAFAVLTEGDRVISTITAPKLSIEPTEIAGEVEAEGAGNGED